MAELKTTRNASDVNEFLNRVENPVKQADSRKLVEMISSITALQPEMWGESIIGWGEYHYRYASGHQGSAAMVGFSPRKQNLTLYLMGCYLYPQDQSYQALFEKLGKHKRGKSCLYINSLKDVDLDVLTELIEKSFQDMKNHNWIH